MGTSGLFRFYYKGKYYVSYNHFDSYKSGLGRSIVDQIKKAIFEGTFDEWKELLDKIIEVDQSVPPSQEEIEKLKEYANLEVSKRSYYDWYCLLHRCQGSLEKVLRSGYIFNCIFENGIPDWDAYNYILNFDTERLDFWRYDTLKKSYSLNSLDNKKKFFTIIKDQRCLLLYLRTILQLV